MRIRAHRHHESSAKINVTPLIDVVMVLIVFFLIVGKLASDRSAYVRLPSTKQGDPASIQGVTVAILPPDPGSDSEPVIIVDATQVRLADVATALRTRLPELASGGQTTPILLRADRSLPYSAIAPVVKACREAGAVSLRLIASRGGEKP